MGGEMEFVRAGERLREQVLMEHYFEVLKYLNEYRSYVVTYTVAPDLLRKQLQTAAAQPDRDRGGEIYQSWTRQAGEQFD